MLAQRVTQLLTQISPALAFIRGAGLYFILPFTLGNKAAADKLLDEIGGDALKPRLQGGGGGGYLISPNAEIGGDGFGYGGRSATAGGSVYGGGQGSALISRWLWQNRWLRLGLHLGVGGGGTGLASKVGGSTEKTLGFGGGGSLIQHGISLDLLLPKVWRVQPWLGLRLGWQKLLIGRQDPRINFKGPYLRLLCGIEYR